MTYKKLPQKFKGNLYQKNKAEIKLAQQKISYTPKDYSIQDLIYENEIKKRVNNIIEYKESLIPEELIKEMNIYSGILIRQQYKEPTEQDEFGFVQRDLVDEIILAQNEIIDKNNNCQNTTVKYKNIEEIFPN